MYLSTTMPHKDEIFRGHTTKVPALLANEAVLQFQYSSFKTQVSMFRYLVVCSLFLYLLNAAWSFIVPIKTTCFCSFSNNADYSLKLYCMN